MIMSYRVTSRVVRGQSLVYRNNSRRKLATVSNSCRPETQAGLLPPLATFSSPTFFYSQQSRESKQRRLERLRSRKKRDTQLQLEESEVLFLRGNDREECADITRKRSLISRRSNNRYSRLTDRTKRKGESLQTLIWISIVD